MKCTLFHGTQPTSVFEFEDGEYLIGSAEHAHVRLAADEVEAEHAFLYITPKGVLVQDLGTAAGLHIRGEKVDRMGALAPGDSVTIGEYSLHIESDTPPAEVRYEIGDIVASGAMGHVRRARELTTGREVAMKQIREEVEDEQSVARFVQEARITAHLEHPNIVPVHEVNPGGKEGRFYTMKMVHGISLQKVVELLRGRIPAVVVKYNATALITIFQKVCDAIAFAHAKGVIHRDLKPANLMVGEYGEVLVMDWGLAKLDGETSTSLPRIVDFTASGADATLVGTIMGTPYYMAPEQAEGQVDYVDARSDIYALGAILYELLTLFPPVDGKKSGEVLANVRAGKIIPIPQRTAANPPPHFPGGQVPASLAAVALKALAYSPERRYQSVTALQTELTAYQAGFATAAESAGLLRQLGLLIRRHRTTFALAAAALALIASLATYFIYQLAAEKDRTAEAATRAIEKEQLATRESARATEQEAIAREKAQTATEEAARALASEQKAKQAQANAEAALEREQTATAAATAAKTAETDARMLATAAKTAEEKAKLATTDAEKMRTEAEMQASIAKEDADKTKNQLGAEKIKKKTEDAANGDIFEDSLGTLHYLTRVLEETPPNGAETTLLRRKVNLALQISPRLSGVWASRQGTLGHLDYSEKHRSFGFSPDGRYFAVLPGKKWENK